MGPGHRYFVSSLAISRSSRSATRVRATVLAYTDLSIQPLHFEWTEPEGH